MESMNIGGVGEASAFTSVEEEEEVEIRFSSRRGQQPRRRQLLHAVPSFCRPCVELWVHIQSNMVQYIKFGSILGLVCFVLGIVLLIRGANQLFYQAPSERNKINVDYSMLARDYNFNAPQLENWCLFGNDDSSCQCERFKEPVSRSTNQKWLAAHEANKERIRPDHDYDVVFLGDELVEEWNGNWYNRERPGSGPVIRKHFQETFTIAGGGKWEGVALGISGDSSANLLWRIQDGELSKHNYAKVFWIVIGGNDLARGGCSEEATLLGILKVALYVANVHAGSVVVIQGILPRSVTSNGALEGTPGALWPSIRSVNQQLESFCRQHEHMIYFDASALFLTTPSIRPAANANRPPRGGESARIISDLMPDYVHLSSAGHKVLDSAIKNTLMRIILDEDEENTVEEGNN